MVKITETEVIKSGERELIDAITGDLDWSAIEAILREKHNLGLQDDVDFRHGDLVIHDNRVAYKLDFDVKITLSVVFDRQGNCLKLTAAGESENEADDEDDIGDDLELSGEDLESSPDAGVASHREEVSQMASEIADMITDINEPDSGELSDPEPDFPEIEPSSELPEETLLDSEAVGSADIPMVDIDPSAAGITEPEMDELPAEGEPDMEAPVDAALTGDLSEMPGADLPDSLETLLAGSKANEEAPVAPEEETGASADVDTSDLDALLSDTEPISSVPEAPVIEEPVADELPHAGLPDEGIAESANNEITDAIDMAAGALTPDVAEPVTGEPMPDGVTELVEGETTDAIDVTADAAEPLPVEFAATASLSDISIDDVIEGLADKSDPDDQGK